MVVGTCASASAKTIDGNARIIVQNFSPVATAYTIFAYKGRSCAAPASYCDIACAIARLNATYVASNKACGTFGRGDVARSVAFAYDAIVVRNKTCTIEAGIFVGTVCYLHIGPTALYECTINLFSAKTACAVLSYVAFALGMAVANNGLGSNVASYQYACRACSLSGSIGCAELHNASIV